MVSPVTQFFVCFNLFILFVQGFHHSQQRNRRSGRIVAPIATPRENRRDQPAAAFSLKESKNNREDNPGSISANSVYFDIEVAGTPIGRLIFHLTNPSPLPLQAENLVQLAKGSRRGIDPKAHYVGCEFDYSPASVEDGMGRYRWGHQLRGRGRNAVGRADAPISDPSNQLKHTHPCFGGQYYGDKYNEEDLDQNDPGVLLTIPITGPGYGGSKFSIVRVRESPQEWQERLLINAGVIGKMDPTSLEVLHAMARQRMGPPTVVGAGGLED